MRNPLITNSVENVTKWLKSGTIASMLLILLSSSAEWASIQAELPSNPFPKKSTSQIIDQNFIAENVFRFWPERKKPKKRKVRLK